MRIVIFHYHLNPGGVTRIIESQIEAIRLINPDQSVLLITGHCTNDEMFQKQGVELIQYEHLNYLTDVTDLKVKYQQIKMFLSDIISQDDILHFHNLNLGKNPLVTLVVSEFAYKGFKVFNHAHDFSEDRPSNQALMDEVIGQHFEKDLKEVMYPDIVNYHFGVLNSHDFKRLKNYYVPEERIDLLPNPVVFNENKPSGKFDNWRHDIFNKLNLDQNKMLVTYPVRVIQRKNIGEFILLAGVFSSKANWVVTQPPQNPKEIIFYNKWKEFCEKVSIDICWEAGNKVDFEKLLRVSDFCISTSIQEGFGMVFMEPWLLNTAVIGRNIPMVTEDMIKSGITFSCLYDSLFVSENKQLHEFQIEEQMGIIRKIIQNKSSLEDFINRNAIIKKVLKMPESTLIEQNKEVILADYSLSNYGRKLHEAYRKFVK